MILTTERFPANVAGIRTFIRVCAFMDKQVVGFGKVTIAVFADELFLWARAESSGGFDVRVQAIGTRWVGVLAMEVLLVKCSVANPVRHENGMVVRGSCTIGGCWWVWECGVR